jgi:hypothetical protein
VVKHKLNSNNNFYTEKVIRASQGHLNQDPNFLFRSGLSIFPNPIFYSTPVILPKTRLPFSTWEVGSSRQCLLTISAILPSASTHAKKDHADVMGATRRQALAPASRTCTSATGSNMCGSHPPSPNTGMDDVLPSHRHSHYVKKWNRRQ